MNEKFAAMLIEGGKKNSLGRVNEVIDTVLADRARLDELYQTIFHEDPWVRMRAIDGFEKICRVHPDWVEPYVDNIQTELATSTQSSIQWHIAEIYRHVQLQPDQTRPAITWLMNKVNNVECGNTTRWEAAQ